MGQKTNPNLFRLIISKKYSAKWYSENKKYSKFLKEDHSLKEIINNSFSKFFEISALNISREESSQKNIVTFNISLLCPKEKEFYLNAYNFFKLKKDSVSQRITAFFDIKEEKLFDCTFLAKRIIKFLKKKTLKELSKFKKDNIYFLKIDFGKNLFGNATLVAKFVGDQIEKRVPYRRLIKQTLENIKLSGIKGAIISISGRLNGAEIARSEIKRYGKVPLHTLKNDIDYCQHKVNTIYGIIGIKIWLNQA
jgi:small subunit ribosomal protein S3